ncbi:MAG: prepilin-type N-terminal cleavage/methylation domain-containing protein [Oscillatoriales cyanobacterium SM2_1_8]|nr:prepilin-type N-terminal cleavage/methylation domain-containing protein [Oscillatoriales cyanobacterium SM2_1_8]
MMKSWPRLFRLGRKPVAANQSTTGFTLIELLVALLIGSLIISSLLFVLVRFLDASRREEAKVATQEELQAALNFIADDLQEAVYIYNADGIERDSTQTPPGIRDQLPHVTNPTSDEICPGPTASPADRRCVPVLVFWKRQVYDANEEISTTDSRRAGCLEYVSPSACDDDPDPNRFRARGTDKFAYSLVAYYISRGQTSAVPVRTARLLRWELKGGIPWSCAEDPSPTAFTNATDCPIALGQRVDRNGTNVAVAALTTPIQSALYADLRDSAIYTVRPDQGFVSPTSTIAATFGTLGQRLNQWRRFTPTYNLNTNPYQVLADYIDDIPYDAVHDDGTAPTLNPTTGSGDDVFEIGIRPNQLAPAGNNAGAVQGNPDCDDPGIGVGNSDPNLFTNPLRSEYAQRVPSTFVSTSGLSSFYVCVNSSRNAVRVYLRGNAWARVVGGAREDRLPKKVEESFFITQNVRAFGRGVLNVE